MNKKMAKILVIATGTMIASASYADEQCAVMNFIPGVLNNGQESVLELTGSNAKSVVLTDKRNKTYQQVVDGEYDYFLEAGKHTIVVNQWNKGDYVKHNKNIRRGRHVANPPQPVQRIFHLDAEAGHAYRIGYSEKNGTYIESDNIKDLSCESVALIEANKSQQLVMTETLPAELENQLLATMNRVAANQKNSKTNVFPIKENQYFGIVFDTNKGNSNGFAVKMIIPNSIASTLDIKPGDIVAKLGDDITFAGNPQNPYALLKQYAQSVPFSKNLKFTISRNGRDKVVIAKHVPVLVPEAFYQLTADRKNDVYGQAKLPKQVQFEFDQLLLALADYYKSNNSASDKVVKVARSANNQSVIDFSLTIDLASANNIKEYLLEVGEEGKMQNRNLRMAAERMGAVVGARNQYTGKDPISTGGNGR